MQIRSTRKHKSNGTIGFSVRFFSHRLRVCFFFSSLVIFVCFYRMCLSFISVSGSFRLCLFYCSVKIPMAKSWNAWEIFWFKNIQQFNSGPVLGTNLDKNEYRLLFMLTPFNIEKKIFCTVTCMNLHKKNM